MPPRLIDVMILGGEHCLMIPDLHPRVQGYQLLNENFFSKQFDQESKTIDKYGLFGGNINYHTYYPDVDPEQFKPNESDYVEPMFRLLSACIVNKQYSPTEFPEDVLKASLPLLEGQTVNCDHETDIGNAIGVVKKCSWQESYTVNGVKIPAGINGVLRIDGKSNPRIVRGLMMDPPSIHSNSVTVQFEWKPSHQFKKEWEFYDKLGTLAEDGTLVRRIATRIISYKETSLVSHGADPFAQMIKDGKIVNPSYAKAMYYSFGEHDDRSIEEVIRKHVDYIDYKHIETISNQEPAKVINHSNNKKMEELVQFINQLKSEGILQAAENAEITKEEALAQLKELLSFKEKNAELETSLQESQSKITDLNNQVATLKEMSTIGETYLSEVRAHALESYKKLTGDKQDEAILNLLATAKLDVLKSLGGTYDQQLEEKFPLKCNKCNSTDISRGSAVHDDENSKDSKNKTSEDENSEVYHTIMDMYTDKIYKK